MQIKKIQNYKSKLKLELKKGRKKIICKKNVNNTIQKKSQINKMKMNVKD